MRRSTDQTFATFAIATTLILSVSIAEVVGQSASADRPNVVLILTDDQGWGDLSLHGNPHVETPHIDQLAQDGLQHTNFYVNPLCAPTRASLLTGQYNLRVGTRWVTDGLENMAPEAFTLGEMFQSADYATGCFGKWHNGAHYPFHPNQQGFDEFVGFCAGHWNNYFNTTLQRNGEPYPTEGYVTDVLTDEALGFIEDNQDQPFFCYLPYNVPHSPFQVADAYYDKYYRMLDSMTNEQERRKLASVYGMCENVDDNVGRIVRTLDSLGLTENTIIIYLSDNGPNGERYNGGMRGTKGSVHEGGVRVPSIVKWPARIEAGSQRRAVGSHIDLMPTLASLCQVPLSDTLTLDGLDLSEWWTDVSAVLPERTLFVQQSDRELTPERGAVRTATHRYVIEPDEVGLYHLASDPDESNNLIDREPTLADSLHKLYDQWFAEMRSANQDYTLTPIGLQGQEQVILPAHESKFFGNVHYKEGHGWAHDWLTNWNSTLDSIWWEVDVRTPTTYKVTLTYTAATAGAEVQLSTDTDHVISKISKAFNPERIPSPDRIPRKEVYEKEWAHQPLGTVRLDAGRQLLVLRALKISNKTVGEVKNLTLKRVTKP